MVTTRTWPYGTTKRVHVDHVEKGFAVCSEPQPPPAQPERWILAFIDLSGVEVGQQRTIICRPGGPTGAYWEFEEEPRNETGTGT